VTGAHPIAAVLVDAAEGRFPPPDGSVEIMPPDATGTWAVIELTGHGYVLGRVSAPALDALGADGFGGVAHPDVLRFLAGPDGWIGCHDAVLARRTGEAGVPPLAARDDLADHPRVVRANIHRTDVVVLGDESGLAVLGRGLAGRLELAVELLDPAMAGSGVGRRLIRGALAAMAPGEWCFAQVSPGNAASLRAFLACGFTPIGSEVLIRPTMGARGTEVPEG
jgi:GNAT superfamily N-acetyltransferase